MVQRFLRDGAPASRAVLSSIALALCAAGATFAAGCGSNGETSPEPEPEPESGPCEIVAMTPSFGAGGVHVHTTLTVKYNQPIDFTAIADRVGLSRLGGEPIAIQVEAAGDDTIAVTPLHDLRFWDDYAFTVSGDVTSADGKEVCPAVNVAFATLAPEEALQPVRPTDVTGSAMIGPSHLLVTSPSGRSLQVYDVADPAHPVIANEIKLEQTPVSVSVAGDRAYVPSGAWGILIFDVSEPQSPAWIGVAGTPGQALEVAPFEREDKKYLAVADGTTGVRIVDVTLAEGAKDVWVGQPLTGAQAVDVQGDLLAVVDRTGWFELYDIATPSQPLLLSATAPAAVAQTFNTSIPANDVLLLGDRLVVAQSYAGLQAFDIQDPSAPTFLSHVLGPQGMCSFGCPDSLLDLHASGGEIFAASAMTGAFRAALDPNGVLGASAILPAAGRQTSVTLANGSLFLGGERGLTVFDQGAPGAGEPLYTELGGWGVHLAVTESGGALYVGSSSRGVETYTAAEPLSPSFHHVEASPGAERDVGLADVKVHGGVVLVGDGRAGVSVFGGQDMLTPALLSNHPTPDSAGEVIPAVDDKLVYVCLDNRGVGVFDISDPAAPVESLVIEELDVLVGGCKDLQLVGDHLYYAGGEGFAVLDTSVPSDPVILAWKKLPAEDLFASFAVSPLIPDRLFATTFRVDWEGTHERTTRLLVFDILDPAEPVRIFRSEDLGGARSVEVRGDKLFIAGGGAGVLVFDLTTPDEPFHEGNIETRGFARDLVFVGQTLYVAEHGGGLGAIHVGELKP